MRKKTVLHINSYYIDNHLYSQLFSKLDHFINQKVYIPIKLNRKQENKVELQNTLLYFDKCIKPSHKFNYFIKINYLFRRLVGTSLLQNVDYVHAHNLFTDGALAYKIFKKYNTPYIVAIRLTDITLQYKFMYHRRGNAIKILQNAEKIIFISPVYRDKLFSMMPGRIVEQIIKKTKIIPNGIHDFWIDNTYPEKNLEKGRIINLLYVGQIMKLKNITNLIEAVNNLNGSLDETKYTLTIVGGENHNEPKYFHDFLVLVEKFDWLKYKGIIKDKAELMQVYRESDIFTMPSKPELFGLVYIEALSQGLPIIYSKGEGIDGFFEEFPVGLAVNPNDIESIANGIKTVSNSTFKNLVNSIEPFNWNNLIKEYLKFYNQDE